MSKYLHEMTSDNISYLFPIPSSCYFIHCRYETFVPPDYIDSVGEVPNERRFSSMFMQKYPREINVFVLEKREKKEQ